VRKRLPGRKHGVRRPEPLALHEDRALRRRRHGFARHIVPVGSDDDGEP
jgi:hypothetical protein